MAISWRVSTGHTPAVLIKVLQILTSVSYIALGLQNSLKFRGQNSHLKPVQEAIRGGGFSM